MSRSLFPRGIHQFGDGRDIVLAIRRKFHDSPIVLRNNNISKIVRITNSQQGISILCFVEGWCTPFRFEHFDIWLAKNCRQALAEYFKNIPHRTLKRLYFGRLKFMIYAALGDEAKSIFDINTNRKVAKKKVLKRVTIKY